MLYMLLIGYDPSVPFEGRNLQPAHAELENELRDKGLYVSGAGLMFAEQGWTRVRQGKALRTEGPFAESKEVAGGYYIVDCDCSEEEAIEIAGRIPVEKRSWVDVRPIALFHPNVERISKIAAGA